VRRGVGVGHTRTQHGVRVMSGVRLTEQIHRDAAAATAAQI